MLINNFSNTKKRDKFYPYFQAYEGNINIDWLTDWLIDWLIDWLTRLAFSPRNRDKTVRQSFRQVSKIHILLLVNEHQGKKPWLCRENK